MTRVTAWVFNEEQLERALDEFFAAQPEGVRVLAPASIRDFLHSPAARKLRAELAGGAPDPEPAKVVT